MKPVPQRSPYDCVRASLASLLEVDYEAVPAFEEYMTGEYNWWRLLNEWTRAQHGFVFVAVSPIEQGFAPSIGHHLIDCVVPSSISSHVVVGLNGSIAYDPSPSPSKDRIIAPDGWWIPVKIL